MLYTDEKMFFTINIVKWPIIYMLADSRKKSWELPVIDFYVTGNFSNIIVTIRNIFKQNLIKGCIIYGIETIEQKLAFEILSFFNC